MSDPSERTDRVERAAAAIQDQVIDDVSVLSVELLRRIDALAADIAEHGIAESPSERARVTRLGQEFAEHISDMIRGVTEHTVEGVGPMWAQANGARTGWDELAAAYATQLSFVDHYVHGFIDGGGVLWSLINGLGDGPWDRPSVTRCLRKRLLFVHERLEQAALAWAEVAADRLRSGPSPSDDAEDLGPLPLHSALDPAPEPPSLEEIAEPEPDPLPEVADVQVDSDYTFSEENEGEVLLPPVTQPRQGSGHAPNAPPSDLDGLGDLDDLPPLSVQGSGNDPAAQAQAARNTGPIPDDDVTDTFAIPGRGEALATFGDLDDSEEMGDDGDDGDDAPPAFDEDEEDEPTVGFPDASPDDDVIEAFAEEDEEEDEEAPIVAVEEEDELDALEALPDDSEEVEALEALPSDELEMLPDEELEALPDEELEALPDEELEAFPDEELEALPDEELEALPDEELEALPDDSEEVEELEEIQALDALDDDIPELPDGAVDPEPLRTDEIPKSAIPMMQLGSADDGPTDVFAEADEAEPIEAEPIEAEEPDPPVDTDASEAEPAEPHAEPATAEDDDLPAMPTLRERLDHVLALAKEWEIGVNNLPEELDEMWIGVLEERVGTLVEKRRERETEERERQVRLESLMALAEQLRIRVRKVPERPSSAWMDKMAAKLAEVQEKRGDAPGFDEAADLQTEEETAEAGIPVPGSPDDSGDAGDAGDAGEAAEAAQAAETERAAAAAKAKAEAEAERQRRVDALIEKAGRVGVPLGRVPDHPTDAWLAETEANLESFLAKRKAQRKAEREKRKRERAERIERIKKDAAELEVDIGNVPPFPTEDWMNRAEIRIASVMLKRGDALEEEEEPEILEAVEEEVEEIPQLVYEEGTLQEKRWIISTDVLIGRAPSSDVQIVFDGGISRRHCKLTVLDDGFEIEDLGSSKGTIVNGKKIKKPVDLPLGSVIQIGDTRLQFAAYPIESPT